MNRRAEHYDVVVCGGGLAGFCAAVAAARHGAKTCLVQDRPVFGGNSSSEVRVVPHGATVYHGYARETGIISELLIEERARNHEPIFENGWTNSVWDMVMYDMALNTPNLSFHLNTAIQEVHKEGRTIRAVVGRVANAETELTIEGETFIDCTGDGIIADLTGCEWRMGSEGRDEFGEPHAPEQGSSDVMGNSIHFKAKDVGRPVPFTLPEWAVAYEEASFFYQGGRNPQDVRGGYWWIEIGVPWHTIHDNENIRHELTRHALGVWDWIKNKDPKLKEKAANYALDWIGQVPGKRESRRIMGKYLMTEHDARNQVVFPDEIAFGGWNVDLHTVGGLLAATSEPTAAAGYDLTSHVSTKAYLGPYGIPLRILIAKDMDNLMMAGRNVSVTHAALGTVRVQGTTALMGQAAGTAAAVALGLRMAVADVPEQAAAKVQQALLRDGCFLPNYKNCDTSDLARKATVTASSEAKLHGVGPQSRGRLEGLATWTDPTQDEHADLLHQRRGQWIAVAMDEGRLDLKSVSVCLSNNTSEDQQVAAKLFTVEHIWDYCVDAGEPLAETILQVPPGRAQWLEWPVNLQETLPERLDGEAALSNRYLRLDLMSNPNVQWHRAGTLEPGHLSAFEMAPGRMRRYHNGLTMSFRVKPPQACYGPANVLSGVTRPHRSTNLWRSDPSEPLAQWLEFSWREPQTIGQVELSFAGHLVREYNHYQPLYFDPQCVKEYGIEVYQGAWREVVRVKANYQRHRRHLLEQPVTTEQLRIVTYATHGDPSAAIYEVRCYVTALEGT